MIWHLLSWYLLLLILGWMTFPLTWHLFSRLADRGYGLSRALGLLLWGFGFWLLNNLGILENRPGGVLLGLVILISASIWAGWRQRDEILSWIKENRRLILLTEAVFLVSFTFMTLVRSSDPDATGTEKPMELAFINAILNSRSFPPHDPWLSGYAISYYHFGYILAGMLAKITATPGAVAFNLMLVVVFSMSATGAYSVLYNMLMYFGKKDWDQGKNLVWALFGPLFLLFVSNLEVLLEMLHQAGVGWDLVSGTSRFWVWINIESLNAPPSQPLTWIPQRFWWWWQASRVIQDIDLLGNVSPLSPIDEFPAFSFVLGDLHPHVLVMPFVMLVIGLSLNIFLGGLELPSQSKKRSLLYRLDLLLVAAITLGGIAFLNTWDLPVYFSLVVGAFILWRVRQKGWEWRRLFELFGFALPLGVLSLVLYAPFFISFQSQAGGILPNVFYPTRGLYLWLMFGALFVPIFLFFGWLWRQKYRTVWGSSVKIVLSLFLFLFFISILLGFIVAQTQFGQDIIVSQGETNYWGLLFSAFVHRLRYGFTLVTLLSLLVIGLAYLLGISSKHEETEDQDDSLPFVLLMIVLGGVMVLAPEFVYLRDVFGARMNTIFKFYFQAWMLWSLSAAFASVLILKKGRSYSKLLLTLFLILGLLYPVLAFPNKTNNFQPAEGYTLDASAYYARQSPDEADGIRWLSQAPFGVVAEAVGGQYSGYARVSTLSGQPSVLGWPGHEGQWRGGYDEVGNREPDMRTLYETPDWRTALEIIKRYDIRYIFIGNLERSTYAVSQDKFSFNLEAGFDQGNVQIYVVPKTLRSE